MRHGKTHNHLGRTSSHRRALLSNMASSLILHKRIKTTVAKAKELRKYVEPLLTKAKADTTHSRRIVFSYLHNKESVKVLFGEVAEKIASREGGYTRIIKLGNRLGDNADLCLIELVDYNDTMLRTQSEGKAKTRRSRRGAGKAKSTETEVKAQETTAPVADETAATETGVAEAAASEVAEPTVENTDTTEATDTNDTAETKE